MPSVASENSAIQHARHHQPTGRARTDNVERDPSSPFAELLDGAAPADDHPTPRKARAERSETARPAENRRKADHAGNRDDAKAAPKPTRQVEDAKHADAKDEAKASDETAKTTKAGEDVAATAVADDGAAAAETDDKTEAALDAEFAAALNALVGDTTQPTVSAEIEVTITLPTAAADFAASAEGAAMAAGETPAVDPLAASKAAEQAAAPGDALQAAEEQVAAAAAAKAEVKTDAKKADTKDEAGALSKAERHLSVDAHTGAQQKGTDDDGEAENNGGGRPGHEIRQVAVKPDTEKPEAKLGDNHGADVSAVARQVAANAHGSPAAATSAHTDATGAASGQSPGLAVTAAPAQPAALTPTQLQVHIQAQLQASADAASGIPLSGVAVEIASQALAGKHRFEIRLDPPELGRIDVKLDIDSDGNATTRLVVERSDTLDLLKRDSSQLERALQQAGLKTSDNALEFSLRQEAFQQNDDQGLSHGGRIVLPDEDTPLHTQRQSYGRLLGMGGGLDIRI